MLIGYKKQFPWGLPTCFKGKIIDGIKKHTIRADIHDRWKPGMLIQHAYGVRTKMYEQFKEGQCISIQTIEILHKSGEVFIKIDDKHYFDTMSFNYNTMNAINELASNDGFDSIEDFLKWFNIDFKGKIIHWTDLRY
jgi:hypothetical protein